MARFAPSPTGPLHLGSLLAAVGSYLDARANGARWLVRIEDLDTPRVVPGCADEHVAHARGLRLRVGRRGALPEHAARGVSRSARDARERRPHLRLQLFAQGSRAAATKTRTGYPGTCRRGPTKPGPTALRFRVRERPIHFDDLFLGPQDFDLATCGDVVVRRRDGLASYQLAVVVDDAFQGVTRVVRGADLLAQHAVADRSAGGARRCRALSTDTCRCWSKPDGAKLSKSRKRVPRSIRQRRPRAYFDPYAFVADPTPRPGPLLY